MIPAGKRRYWIWGAALAFVGVLIARVVSQESAANARGYVRGLGVLIAMAGIFVIMLGTRRKG
jgi:MFS superfamily sulfate permease-like transporter